MNILTTIATAAQLQPHSADYLNKIYNQGDKTWKSGGFFYMRNYILQRLPSYLNTRCEAKKPCACVCLYRGYVWHSVPWVPIITVWIITSVEHLHTHVKLFWLLDHVSSGAFSSLLHLLYLLTPPLFLIHLSFSASHIYRWCFMNKVLLLSVWRRHFPIFW